MKNMIDSDECYWNFYFMVDDTATEIRMDLRDTFVFNNRNILIMISDVRRMILNDIL